MNATTPASSRTVLIGLAALGSLCSIGFGIYELRAVRTDSAALASLQRHHSADEQRLSQLEQAAKSAAALNAQADAKPNGSLPASASATVAQGQNSAASAAAARGGQLSAADRREVARAAARAFFSKNPQARDMMVEFMTRNMQNYYAPFFRAAGLSQAQIDAFVGQTAQLHIDSEEMTPGGEMRIGQMNLPDDTARSILGDNGFQQWKNALQTMPAQSWAEGLALAVKNGAPPLSSDQVDQLTQAVAANSPDYGSGKNINLQSVDWASAMQQAQTLMTGAQWQQAQNFLTFQAANRQLQALIKKTQ